MRPEPDTKGIKIPSFWQRPPPDATDMLFSLPLLLILASYSVGRFTPRKTEYLCSSREREDSLGPNQVPPGVIML